MRLYSELLEGVIHRIGDQQRQLMDKERATVQQQRDRMVRHHYQPFAFVIAKLGMNDKKKRCLCPFVL